MWKLSLSAVGIVSRISRNDKRSRDFSRCEFLFHDFQEEFPLLFGSTIGFVALRSLSKYIGSTTVINYLLLHFREAGKAWNGGEMEILNEVHLTIFFLRKKYMQSDTEFAPYPKGWWSLIKTKKKSPVPKLFSSHRFALMSSQRYGKAMAQFLNS